MVNKMKKVISSLVVLSLVCALFPRSALATWQAPANPSETAHAQTAARKQTVEIDSSGNASTEKFIQAAKQGNVRIVVKSGVSLAVQNPDNAATEPSGSQKGRMKPVLFAAGTEVIGESGATLSFRSPIQLTGNDVSFQDIAMKFNSSDALSSIPHREIFLAGYSLTLNNVATNNELGSGSFGASESNLLPLVFAGGYKSTSDNNYNIGDHAQLTVTNAKDGQTRFQAIYLDHSDTLSAGNLVHAPIATTYTKPVTLNLASKTEIIDGSKGNVNFPSGIFAKNTEKATINFIGESGTSPSVPAFTLDGTTNTTVKLTNVSLDTRSTLKNVGEVIIGDKAEYLLNDSFSTNNSVNKLTLNAGGTLKPTGSVILKGNFVGGGTIYFYDEKDKLEIQGTVSGQTALTQFGSLQPGHRITTNRDVSKDAFTMEHSTYTLVSQEKNGKLHWIVQNSSSSIPALGSVMFKMGTYQILELTVKLNELQSGYDSQEFKAVCSDPSDRYINPNESDYELLLGNYAAVKSSYWDEKDSGKYNDRTDWAGEILMGKVSNSDDMFHLYIGDKHKQAEDYTLLFFKPSANIPEDHAISFKEFCAAATKDNLVSGGTLKVKLVNHTTPPPTPPTEATFTLEPTKTQYTFGEQSSFTFSSSDTSVSNKNVVISCNGEKLAEQTLVNGKATLTYDTQTRKLQPGANTITATYDGHANAATCTVTILAKPLDKGMFADIDAQTFTGNKIEPVVSPTPSSTLQEGDYTVSYRDNVNVGTATATIQAKENGYFSGTADKTFAINKANYGNQTAQSSTKFGATGQLDLTPYLCAGAVIGTVTVSADQQTILEGTPSIAGDGKTLTYQFKNDASAHIGSTAEISIPVTAANYKDYTITVTVTVANKLPQADFGFPNAVVNKSYHDVDFTIPATGANTGSAVTYRSSKADVAVVDERSGTVTITGVGSTIVTATASATADYAETTASYTIHVDKSTIQITANSKTAYVGDSVPVLGDSDYLVRSLRNGETLKTKPTLQYASTPDMSKPGTVAIQISGAAVADGKEGCYDLSYVPGTLTIRTNPNNGGGNSNGGNSGGGNNNPPNNSGTTQNPDGSTTVTVTKPNGSKVETTTFPNGDKTIVETKKDGSSITETKKADGTVATTTVDKSGKTNVQVNVSDKAVQDAVKENQPVTLPISPVEAKPDSLVQVNLGSKEKVDVTIPAKNSLSSLVAIIVHEDGTEEVMRKSISDKTGVTFSVENHTTIKLMDNAKSFADVNAHWAKDAIDFVTSHELYRGTSETTFSPERGMTRGMLTMVLHNLESNPKHFTNNGFTDVPENSWYSESILWATEKGIVSGYGNGSFGPDNNISREQVAVMLWRYAGSPMAKAPLEFDDSAMVADFAKDAMQWAVERGIIGGTGNNTLNPKGTATRAQVATMVTRSMKEIL